MHRTETVGVATGGVLTNGSSVNMGGLYHQRFMINLMSVYKENPK
jgi:hypothetical protein